MTEPSADFTDHVPAPGEPPDEAPREPALVSNVPPEGALVPDAAPSGEVVVASTAGPRLRQSYIFLAAVAVLSLVADLATKAWAEKTLQHGSAGYEIPTPKVVIRDVFAFSLAKNRGGAWGLLQSAAENVRKPFFVVVSVLAILFIVSLYRRLHPRQQALKWGLPLVLGGALGNLIDRIRYGFVIDFIDVQATYKGAPHHWPTFNVADIAICVGVGLMALDMLSARRREPPSPPADAAVDPLATRDPTQAEPLVGHESAPDAPNLHEPPTGSPRAHDDPA